MKSGQFFKWSMGLALSLIPWVATCQTNSNLPPPEASADEDADVTAAVTPVQKETSVPAGVRPTSPTAEIIRLANSGVQESVLLAYVTNSPSTFNLGAEEIIYLNDLGVPSTVVTAMIQRDQALKSQAPVPPMVAAANAPTNPTFVAPIPNPPPQTAAAQPSYPPPPPVEAPLTPPEPANSPDFYGSLSPYGTWVDVAGYGRCWQPTVVALNPDWQPYFDGGRWVYTDSGWYWMSDYSWGWAPFHYGRWFRHARMGWCWAPDTVWGPSWVSWRYSDDYCGWAPLPPGCFFSFEFGLTFRGRHLRDFDDCGLGHHRYHFVAWNHFDAHHLHDHALGRHDAERIFNHTVVVNRISAHGHTVVNHGIAPDRVSTATHRPIHTVALHEVSGGRGFNGRAEQFDAGHRTLNVYHPGPGQGRTGPMLAERTHPDGHGQGGGLAPRQPSAPRAPSAPSAPSAPNDQIHSGAHVRPGSNPPRTSEPIHSGAHVQPASPGASVTTGKGGQPPLLNRPYQPTQQPGYRPGQNPTPWQNVSPGNQVNPPARATVPQPSSTATYQAPNRPTAVEVPRYNSAPPQRAYAPPANSAPTVSRPSGGDVPRYAPPAQSAPSAPSRPSGGDVRPAPSAPPAAPARSSDGGNRDNGNRGGGGRR